MDKSAYFEFRPDIQGLRAIAVMLVILAHAGIPWLAGGFVGVDVFFVLSGFLINGLLVQEYQAKGHLDLGAFYLRRLRRLLPAMLMVIIATMLAVGGLFPEIDARQILASLPFAATWTSNMFFVLREQDYFNELGERDVFLHTWSLGVEEQFYLIWPLLLLGLIALVRMMNLRLALLMLVAVSFLVSAAWTYWHPLSAFYMMPARIWQFGLGGLVYLHVIRFQIDAPPVSQGFARALLVLGLLMIMGSALLLNQHFTYPGFWAIFPSLGAAFVILAGHTHSSEARIGLAHPLLVWVGDHSYSLYLWHWPIITLIGLLGLEVELGHRGLLLALVLTVLLATLSYRWIELPFWKKDLSLLPPKTFLLGASAMVLLVLAMAFHVQRVPPDTAVTQMDLAASIRSDLPLIYQMPCDAWYQHAKVEPCVFGPEDAPNTAVLLADSIGAQWFSAWASIFSPPEWRFVVLTKSACAMVDEDYFYPRIGKIYDVCRKWREDALKRVASFKPKVVLVGSAATYGFTPTQWVEGSRRVLEPLSAIAERVIVVSGTPVLGFDGPSCIARALQAGNKLSSDDCIGTVSTDKYQEVAAYLSQAASDFENVQILNPVEWVCPNGRCRAVLPTGIPVFRDSQHLTDTFARSSVTHVQRMVLELEAK
jgi:peptidoglycan/LPS O-acetylase OafA/YrhL